MGNTKDGCRLDTVGPRPYCDPALGQFGEIFGKEVNTHMMSKLNALIASFRREDEGQGLAEYALILALIAIIAIVALIFLGGQVSTILSNVGHSV
jgi:pilus assembly protein Flp/PilA